MPEQSLRLLMFGTGDFAVPTFHLLCQSDHEVVGLVTQPDRPQGRNQVIVPSQIKAAAVERGIPVFQPENVNLPESLEHVRALGADLFITAAYGQILSEALLGIPRFGGLNLHGSVLPAYRGAAPVARAIQRGETETGVTVIRMTPRIDAGGMVSMASTPIQPDETAGELEARLAALGAPLVLSAIRDVAADRVHVIPQDSARVTRAPKLRKDDGIVDWTKTAQQVHDLVRAMQPWPMASTYWLPQVDPYRAPLRLILHKTAVVDALGSPGEVLVATGGDFVVGAGEKAVAITRLQVPGKRPMETAEFLRGNHVRPGDLLGTSPEAPRTSS